MVNSDARGQPTRLERLLADAGTDGYLTVRKVEQALQGTNGDERIGVERLEQLLEVLRAQGVVVYDESEIPQDGRGEGPQKPDDGENGSVEGNLSDISTDDKVGLYFAEIGPVPLLTHRQEIELAKLIERGLEAECRLSNNGCGSARDTLLRDVRLGQDARDQLIRANTRLVISVAKKYMGLGLPFLDLIQAGNVGLIKAADRFDYNRGTKFSTYATWWIRQAVTRCLSQQSTTIRIPVHMGDRIRGLRRTAQRLEQLLERRPTPEEIAEETGDLTAENVRWLLRVSRSPISLEKPIGEDGDDELGSLIEDETSPSPVDTAEGNLLRESLSEMMGTLSPREARVLRMRFGFDGRPAMSLEEVGDKIGVTRERARQIVQQALRKLRHPRHTRRLRGYLS
jgi:RNA polymerase primary sigma factor